MEDRAAAIGNIHQTFCEDWMCGSGDMLAGTQADTLTSLPLYLGEKNYSRLTVNTNGGIPAIVALTAAR